LFWPFVDRVLVKKFPGKEISFWIGVAGSLPNVLQDGLAGYFDKHLFWQPA